MSLLRAENQERRAFTPRRHERLHTAFTVPKSRDVIAAVSPMPNRQQLRPARSQTFVTKEPSSSVRAWVSDGAYVFSRFGYVISTFNALLATAALISYYAGIYLGESLLGAALVAGYATFWSVTVPVFLGSLALSGVAKYLRNN